MFSDLAPPTTTPLTTARTSTTDLEQCLSMEIVIPNSYTHQIMKYLPKTYKKNQTNQPLQTYCKIISDMVEYQ